MFRWTSARRLPTTMERRAMTARIMVQRATRTSPKETVSRRSRNRNATALVPTAMKPVMGVGAPS
jgi:hypothetical protein